MNASALNGQGHLIDSSTILADGNGTRRIRVTTPFGVTTSTMADGFTVSATPFYLPSDTATSLATFAGTTDDNGANALMDYNATNGNLIVNGSNFRGINQISLLQSDGTTVMGSVAVDPNAAPSGITVNAAGTQITMTQAAIDAISATWLGTTSTARTLRLRSAASETKVTPTINVLK